jgi:hypothetical protein
MNNLHSEHLAQVSRREFLQLAAAGMLAGLFHSFIPPLNSVQAGDSAPRIGRVLNDAVAVYEKPSYDSRFIKMFYKDLIVSINNITVGDDEPAHNRVWYFVNDLGYAHSGGIQPVQINTNPVVEGIPEIGQLAELTVPFTDTYKDLEKRERVVFRIYYSSVFWVHEFVKSSDGKTWYKIWDDKFKFFVYANAAHLRLLPEKELLPLVTDISEKSKKIQVNLSQQVLIAYQDDQPVYMTRTATGARFIDGNFTTPAGQYILHRKRPTRHMADGDFAAPKTYDLPGVPWVTYMSQNGAALHGTYWHNDFGKPRSHGCINVSSEAAKWLYLWTTPVVPFDQDYWEEDSGTILDVV